MSTFKSIQEKEDIKMEPDRELFAKLKLENDDLYGVMVTKALDNVWIRLFHAISIYRY